MTIKHIDQIDLSLINGFLHCYMFRFPRNLHTKHLKQIMFFMFMKYDVIEMFCEDWLTVNPVELKHAKM